MNHASTISDGARHIDAFIDALAGRHRRLARLTLLTRAALVVALIWVAALGVWFLVARESTSAQTLLVAAALSASIAAVVLAWRQQGPPPTRRHAWRAWPRTTCRASTIGWSPPSTCSSDNSPAADGPLAQLLLDDTARRVARRRPRAGRAGGDACAARRTGPRRRDGALAVLAFVGPRAGGSRRAARCGCGRFRNGWRSRSAPGDARVRPASPFTVRATTSEAARGLVPDITVRMQDATRTARMKAQPDGAFAFGFESVPALVCVSGEGRRSVPRASSR